MKGGENEDVLKESFLNPFGLPVMNLDDSLFFGGIEKLIPFDTEKETGKHGALTNIFSCWNGMVGTGLFTIPWAYSQSGIVLGIILTIVAFIISFTT